MAFALCTLLALLGRFFVGEEEHDSEGSIANGSHADEVNHEVFLGLEEGFDYQEHKRKERLHKL